MNNQPAEKQHHDQHGAVEVHSVFQTIQGEGPFTGQRALFVRLAGCNLACPMCDTEYTDSRTVCFPQDVVDWAALHGALPGQLVVITGGEPFRQNIRPMVESLLIAGYRVQIETNGTLYQDLPYERITVVCSPKTGAIHKRLEPHIAALKYVLDHRSKAPDDGLPLLALGHTASPRLARPPAGFRGTIYIQPVDVNDPAENKINLDATVESVLGHGYTLCLQTHKIINVE